MSDPDPKPVRGKVIPQQPLWIDLHESVGLEMDHFKTGACALNFWRGLSNYNVDTIIFAAINGRFEELELKYALRTKFFSRAREMIYLLGQYLKGTSLMVKEIVFGTVAMKFHLSQICKVLLGKCFFAEKLTLLAGKDAIPDPTGLQLVVDHIHIMKNCNKLKLLRLLGNHVFTINVTLQMLEPVFSSKSVKEFFIDWRDVHHFEAQYCWNPQTLDITKNILLNHVKSLPITIRNARINLEGLNNLAEIAKSASIVTLYCLNFYDEDQTINQAIQAFNFSVPKATNSGAEYFAPIPPIDNHNRLRTLERFALDRISFAMGATKSFMQSVVVHPLGLVGDACFNCGGGVVMMSVSGDLFILIKMREELFYGRNFELVESWKTQLKYAAEQRLFVAWTEDREIQKCHQAATKIVWFFCKHVTHTNTSLLPPPTFIEPRKLPSHSDKKNWVKMRYLTLLTEASFLPNLCEWMCKYFRSKAEELEEEMSSARARKRRRTNKEQCRLDSVKT